MPQFIDDAREQMLKTIENTKDNFAGIRTGRANPALLNGITADYYGVITPITQMASIAVPESRVLTVTAFDKTQVSTIEKAIRDSDLGVSPNRDGDILRITLPELTEERRKDYVKLAKERAEDGKIALRNIRRRIREEIEGEEKDGAITEDDEERAYKELDNLTKKYSDEIDTLLSTKEKEILSIE